MKHRKLVEHSLQEIETGGERRGWKQSPAKCLKIIPSTSTSVSGTKNPWIQNTGRKNKA
jgi:hypothetical protein